MPPMFGKFADRLQKSGHALWGSVLFACASGACVAWIAILADPQIALRMHIGLGLLVLGLGVAFWWQQRCSAVPEFPPAFLSRGNILRANLIGFVATVAGGSMVFLASDIMLNELGWAPGLVGFVFLPDAIAAAVGARIAPVVTVRWGFFATSVVALLSIALGMGMIAVAPASPWELALAVIVAGSSLVGFGLVLAAAATFIEASSVLNDDEHGRSAGLISATQQWGIGIGTALLVSAGHAWHESLSLDPVRLSILGGGLFALVFAGLTLAISHRWLAH
jgi:hypothetical protein